LISDF